jgi:hypothetical protein
MFIYVVAFGVIMCVGAVIESLIQQYAHPKADKAIADLRGSIAEGVSAIERKQEEVLANPSDETRVINDMQQGTF